MITYRLLEAVPSPNWIGCDEVHVEHFNSWHPNLKVLILEFFCARPFWITPIQWTIQRSVTVNILFPRTEKSLTSVKSLQTKMTSCACDPTFRDNAFDDDDCDEDICWGYHLTVCIVFFLATLWVTAVGIQSLRMGYRKFSIKETILVLMWLCFFCKSLNLS